MDQQGNRFECELRNVADPPLLIEYTGDTFKIKLTKDLAQKDEENFKVSEKQDWTPEVDYSKISVQDLQVVMDVDEAGPAKEVELSSNIVSQNFDPIPPISKDAGIKMIVDQEENLPSSLSEIVAVPETMDVQATTSCDQQNTQIIFPKKELKTRPAILIDNSDIEIPQIPEKSVVLAVESSEIESPVYVGVSDNDYFQPKFETKEETTEDQGNLDDYPVEPEVQPSQSQEFCEPQQEQYQEYYENPEPYCEDQPVLEVQTEIQENDPEIEQEDDQEEPSMMDAISEFVNNFDLSSLVLIETEVNGKTVQEVHTMDPETEEVSSEPIDCPQAIKDYLIKHMQGGEDSDDDEEEDE